MPENSTKKDRTWLLPREKKSQIHAGLHLVPTPIGNMEDISLRALDVLEAADVVICEDTRVTKKLLGYFGISAKLVSYNDHSDDKKRGDIIKQLREGKTIALVSDAGTPLISDPGYKLVRDAADDGIYITALPGANAVLPALQLSALPTDQFCFLGFVPSKATARDRFLKKWISCAASLVVYETAPRLKASLKSIAKVMGDRDIAVVREISKLYEEARRGKASELLAYYEGNATPKGEIVLVIAGAGDSADEYDLHALLSDALESMSTKDAAAHVAEISGMHKKELYALALDIQKND